MKGLSGEHYLNIDAKGRLSIPAKLRGELGEHFVITKGLDHCLNVYPENEWNAFAEKLRSLHTTTDMKARGLVLFFQGSAVEGELDKQGRTLISAPLRKFAYLEKEVVFVGVENHAEIWDLKRWEDKIAEIEDHIGDFAASMENGGVGF